MGTVTGADFRRILGFLHTAMPGTRADPLPRPTLAALTDVIPADFVAYFELRRADRFLIAQSSNLDFRPDPDIDSAILAFGHQNPLRWRNFGPADGALRLSRVISYRQLQRLDFYDTVMRPARVRDTIKIWLSSTPVSASCVALERMDGEFSQRDQDVLGVLHQHLAAMRQAALADEALADSDGAGLTPREAQVLSWVALGRRNEEIARLLFISPATVRKHLEQAYEKLGAHSRADAVARLTRSGPPH